MDKYDVIIAGAGPAGLGAAAECGGLGLSTLLVERNQIGTTQKTWSDFPQNIKGLNLEDAVTHTSSRVIQRAYTGLDLTTDAEMVFLDSRLVLNILRSRIDENHVEILENCNGHSFNNQTGVFICSEGKFKTELLIDATGYKSQGELDSLDGLTFDQFGLQKDILLQTFAAVCEDTNLSQSDSIMFDLPFATKERVWYWVNPLGDKKAWIGAMYLTKKPLPWKSIKNGLTRYMKCRGIKSTKIDEKKGFIPSFRLENKIHRDRVLHTGDAGPGAVPGTFFGFVSSIEHGKHVANMAKIATDNDDYSRQSFQRQEKEYYDSKRMLNYLLGVIGERMITPTTDVLTSKLLRSLADCGEDVMIRRLKTDLDKRDVKTIIKSMWEKTTMSDKLSLIKNVENPISLARDSLALLRSYVITK